MTRGVVKPSLAKNVVWTVLGVAVLAAAQDHTLRFEVVSIKPCDLRDLHDLPPNAANGPIKLSATTMHASCWGVQALIRMAYGVPVLEGGPDWIKSTRYTIDAKADAPAGQDAMCGPMLRAALEERMQVKTHREMRDKPVYELRVTSGGFKLKPMPDDSCTPRDPADPRRPLQPGEKPYCGQSSLHRSGADLTYDLHGVTVEEFAARALIDFDRPVVDKTGIQGKYDFHLQFSTDETNHIYRPPDGSPVPEFPSLMTVLQNIGLKLVPGKDPQEFLIIDGIERPSAN